MTDFKLNNDPKIEPGFNIPENYFDTLSENIFSQLPSKEIKKIGFTEKLNIALLPIAAILIIALCLNIYNRLQIQNQNIESQAIVNYIASESEIPSYEIISLLNEDDIQKMKIDLDIENKIIEDELVDHNIEHYVLD